MLADSGQLAAASSATAVSLASFSDVDDGTCGCLSNLDRQVRGVKNCLESLGPWGAAAAAHLDLLAAAAEGGAGLDLPAVGLCSSDDDQEPAAADADMADGDGTVAGGWEE